jgi:hypothetical protein
MVSRRTCKHIKSFVVVVACVWFCEICRSFATRTGASATEIDQCWQTNNN